MLQAKQPQSINPFSIRVSPDEMALAAETMEQDAGSELGFDIGLCFPDVVIQNRIIGGETYKPEACGTILTWTMRRRLPKSHICLIKRICNA